MSATVDAPDSETATRLRLRVLVCDDQPDVREALRLLLKSAGYVAETADSPGALLRASEARIFDLILMDMNYSRDTTSGDEGLDLLARLHAREHDVPVIVMTAWGNVDLAVEAMRRGACDFVQKPWDNDRLLATLERQAREAAARHKVERQAKSELEIAREVQRKLFPKITKRLATVDYAGDCAPAREIGGDYYDFLDLGLGQMGFVLADVSGKGVPAALLMANLQASIRSQVDLAVNRGPAMLGSVNKLFLDSTPIEQYATLFFARYEERSRRLYYVNCGHLAPILARANGEIERLEATATVIGVFPDWSCQERSVELAPGDTLLVYSDGVVEAGIDGGEEFGEQRLIALLETVRSRPIDEMVRSVIGAARDFGAGQGDDITVVAVRAS